MISQTEGCKGEIEEQKSAETDKKQIAKIVELN